MGAIPSLTVTGRREVTLHDEQRCTSPHGDCQCQHDPRPPISGLSITTKPSNSHNVRILSEIDGPPQKEGTNVDDKGSEVQGSGGPTLANPPPHQALDAIMYHTSDTVLAIKLLYFPSLLN